MSSKRNILGVRVDAVDYDSAVAQVISAAHERIPFSVSALAVHGLMTGVLDNVHRYRLNHLDLVVPDGQPVRWALNRLHKAQLQDRVYGPILTLNVCRKASEEGLSIYLFGSHSKVLASLKKNLCLRFPDLIVAGYSPSKFRQITIDEKRQIVREIIESGARITFVGLGCPRQEVWTYENTQELSMPVLAVGAAFDFHAGIIPQAPTRLQSLGLEWLYRLCQEPHRLWKRYVLLNPMYIVLVVMQALRLRKFAVTDAIMPSEELRYG